MNLKQQTRENNKKYIAKIAFDLFSEKGIDSISMPQVAKVAKVGTTSIYRYYETKLHLVIAAAESACQQIGQTLIEGTSTDVFMRKTGLEQIWYILGGYLKLYDSNRNFLKFMYDFDNFLSLQDIEHDTYIKYMEDVQVIEPYFIDAIEKGKQDGTIKKNVNSQLLYMTTTDFVLGFCSRIAYYELCRSKKTLSVQREQLALALEICYAYLKK